MTLRLSAARPALSALLLLGLIAGCEEIVRKEKRAEPLPPSGAREEPGPEALGEQAERDDEVPLFDTLTPPARKSLPGALMGFQQVFADVAEQAIPAVVSIQSERNVGLAEGGGQYDEFMDNGPFRYFFGLPDGPGGREGNGRRKETGLGSGVIISPGGYVLTNNHVIEGADAIKVKLHDETEYEAEIVGTDKPTDMAVIRVKGGKGKFPTLPLGDSEKLRIGEWVIAVGNPYGLSHTVTTGIISAKGRKNTGINSYENFIQTDAAINPGNSGGALLSLSGELIGINTAIFSRSGGYQGIGFAIPINMAKKITQDLIRDGEVTRGWLGVSIQPIEAELADAMKLKDRHGALVGGVVPGSPADKAGIRRGDVIFKVDEGEIKDANDLLNRIALLAPRQWVQVWVLREGMTLAFKARIARRDEGRMAGFHGSGGGNGEEGPEAVGLAGLKVDDLNPEIRRRYRIGPALEQGALVIQVEPDSRAAGARLREGDVILEVNREKIHDAAAFRAAMGRASKGNKILLLINRGGSTFFTTL
ncbi:MAG TPA: DegQ family serine endoprotease [Fibrobacteria bacterium]|nr:DegQ family serine endoprotease [Fibrobacteria bacterium]